MVRAFCSHCEADEEMLNPKPGRTLSGRPMRRGKCAVCGNELMLVEQRK